MLVEARLGRRRQDFLPKILLHYRALVYCLRVHFSCLVYSPCHCCLLALLYPWNRYMSLVRLEVSEHMRITRERGWCIAWRMCIRGFFLVSARGSRWEDGICRMNYGLRWLYWEMVCSMVGEQILEARKSHTRREKTKKRQPRVDSRVHSRLVLMFKENPPLIHYFLTHSRKGLGLLSRLKTKASRSESCISWLDFFGMRERHWIKSWRRYNFSLMHAIIALDDA